MSEVKDENLIAFTVSKTMGWSIPFGRLYTLYRIHNGDSHVDAFDLCLASPIISEKDKPRHQALIVTDFFKELFS